MSDLRDPFNPDGGEFAKNIRAITGLDDTELRKSLKQFGWIKELPAIMDENGVVLVGHRRLRLAKQLGIEPVVTKIKLGKGEEADAERLKLAIASNIGGQPMTKDDRKRIAEYLYGTKEWTMEKIADALDVGTKTVSRDLANFVSETKSKPAKTQTNPKGAGRPKGSNKPRAERSPKATEREEKIEVLQAAGLSAQEISDKVGLGLRAVHQALEHIDIRREAEAKIDPSTLSLSAQEKLAAAIRQAQRKLDIDFEVRVLEECKHRMDAISLPQYAKELAELERSISSRKGIMDRLTYRKILACLHPDRVNDPTLKKRYEEAFRLFSELEKRVLDERESPTTFRKMPRTYEELMALKAKVTAERRARRAASKSGVSVR